MAAKVSPWGKPGAWALESEEHEDELLQQHQKDLKASQPQETADFPSLSAAAANKPKKKKGQTFPLAEFTTYGGPKPTEPRGLTHQDRLVLPTGPRERTAEELDRTRPGGGFKPYGMGGDRGSRGDDSRWVSRGSDRNGGSRESNRESGPSRADEIDNWAAAKKSSVGNGFERKERGGFFDSQSKADEVDSWVSNKNFVPSEGRRFGGGGGGGGFERDRKVGFGSSGGADSDNWGRKKEDNFIGSSGGGFERERRVGFGSNGGGADVESWGKKEEESVGGTQSARPRLNLQPRSLPLSGENSPVLGTPAKPKGSNPFGAARPREEVLSEKGQDWKKIDEQLESVKIKEANEKADTRSSFGKRSFGSGNARADSAGDRTEKSWRKPDSDDSRPQSAEKSENGHAEEN